MYIEHENNSELVSFCLTKIGGQEMIIESMKNQIEALLNVIKGQDLELKINSDHLEVIEAELTQYEGFSRTYQDNFRN
jgi:hypothetical protein